MRKVALVRFTRGSFNQEYSYRCDIEGLENGDILVVPTNNSYSVGVFQRYSTDKLHIKAATKLVVQRVDVEAYEMKLFLEEE